MEFKPEDVEDFRLQFDSIRHKICKFPGVQHLELHRDTSLPNVF